MAMRSELFGHVLRKRPVLFCFYGVRRSNISGEHYGKR
jgi:hypothetical protein